MWHTWLQKKAVPGKPQCWWMQLEREARIGLPFAHLFPRPPAGGGPGASESQRLVQALRQDASPQQAHLVTLTERAAPRPPALPAPVEAAADPVGARPAAEPEGWGPDGALVLAWFEQGELEAAAAGLEAPLEAEPLPRGLPGLLARLRRRWQRPEGYEWAGAEL